MSKVKTFKRKLSDLSHDELVNEVRRIKAQRDEARSERDEAVNNYNAVQQSLNEALEAVETKDTAIDDLNAAIEELTAELELARTNNTKLQALVESSGGDVRGFDDSRIVNRLDILINILTSDADNFEEDQILPVEDEDALDDEPAQDTNSQEDAGEDFNDEDEDDLPEPEVIQGAEDISEDAEVIQGTDELIESPVTNEDATEEVTDEEILEEILPQIKAAIELFGQEQYNDQVIEAIKNGNLSKELALKQLMAMITNDEEEANSTAEGILNSEVLRDAVYEAMGI